VTSAQPNSPPPAQASEAAPTPEPKAAKAPKAAAKAPKAEGESEAEAAAPDPEAEAEGRRLADARTAYALRQQEKQLAQQRAELDLQARQMAAEKAARAKQLADEEALDEIALVEAIAKRTGKGVDEVVRGLIARVQNGGKATVEQQLEVVAKDAKEAREYAAQLEARLRADAEAAAEAYDVQRKEAYLNELRDSYASALDENHHPILSTMDPAEVAERGLVAANAYVLQGYPMPTAEAVLEYLEKVEHTEFVARATKAGYSKAAIAEAAAAATEAAQPAATGVDASDWSPPARGGLVYGAAADAGYQPSLGNGVQRNAMGQYVAPRAVTNNDAAARGTAPIDWRNMDERDRVAAAGREVFGKRA